MSNNNIDPTAEGFSWSDDGPFEPFDSDDDLQAVADSLQRPDNDVRSLADLLARPTERRRFLVEGLLPADGITQLTGRDPKLATLLGRSLALTIGSNLRRWNNQTIFEHGPVLWVSSDDRPAATLRAERRQLAAICEQQNVDPETIEFHSLTVESAPDIDQILALTTTVAQAAVDLDAVLVVLDGIPWAGSHTFEALAGVLPVLVVNKDTRDSAALTAHTVLSVVGPYAPDEKDVSVTVVWDEEAEAENYRVEFELMKLAGRSESVLVVPDEKPSKK